MQNLYRIYIRKSSAVYNIYGSSYGSNIIQEVLEGFAHKSLQSKTRGSDDTQGNTCVGVSDIEFSCYVEME